MDSMDSSNSRRIVKLESIEILPSDSQDDTEEPTASLPGSFRFKCTLCPLTFNEKQEFHSHVRDHFKPITCKNCNKTFIGDKQYAYHRKHVHGGASKSQSTSPENETIRRGMETGNMEIKTEYLDDITLVSIETLATNFACDVCGRLFANNEAAAKHRRTHTNEGKRFFCNVCNSGFNKKTNLEFHLRIHTKERPFTCDQCSKSFSHVSGLNCHRRIHTGERPYICPFCPKKYAHSTDLRRHRRTHGLEEKRFTCDLCPKQFFENKFLRSHMRTHHRNQNNVSGNKYEAHVIEIGKFDEEYIDYEYIQSD